MRMADAPLGRTPKEAEAGKLSTFVGGDPDTVRELKPIIECYADTIIEAGRAGRRPHAEAHQQFHLDRHQRASSPKRSRPRPSLASTCASSTTSCRRAARNSKMFQMIMPWVLEGDDSHLKGPLRIAGKDMRFYTQARRERAGDGVHRAGGQPDLPAREHPGPRRAVHAGAARASSPNSTAARSATYNG